MRSALEFPNQLTSAALARRFVGDALTGAGTDVIDAATIMASELATNSMRHAETPFTVTVDRAAASVTVSVEDAGPGRPTLQSPAPTHPSGRGLRIVDALADSWGVTPRPDGNGKRVWFTLAMGRPDTPTRHEAIADTR